MDNLVKKLAPAVILLGVALGAVTASAQEAPGAAWSSKLDIYGWGTGLSGSVGPAIKQNQVEASFSDITNVLDFAAMAHFEASKGRWGLMADLFYVNLGHSEDNSFGSPVRLNLEDTILGLEGTYRVYGDSRSSFDLTLGARYNDVRTDITPYLLQALHQTLSWADPVLGVKGGVKMGEVWSFGYRFDVGGFGVGSDFSVLASLRFDAKLSRSTSLGLGYALYKVDYEAGSGNGNFIYDTTLQGPFLGVSFRF